MGSRKSIKAHEHSLYPLLQRVDRCPTNEWCKASRIYQHKETGEYYDWVGRYHKFLPHEHRLGNVSTLPDEVFLGVFRNTRTGFIRYGLPCRQEYSAMIPPKDSGIIAKGRRYIRDPGGWEFVKLLRLSGPWVAVEPSQEAINKLKNRKIKSH